MLLADPRNPRAGNLLKRLQESLDEKVHEGVVWVLGGDGFLLKSVAEHGLDKTYLGLGCGQLGFLMNEVYVDDPDWMDRLRNREWQAKEYPILEARITLQDGRETIEKALNDVCLLRSSGLSSKLKISVDGHVVVDRLGGDGVVLATTLGSTAYSFSAGGTPHHPEIPALLLTPICPHRPKLSPVVLPSTSRVRVDVIQADRRPVAAMADGRDIPAVSRMDVGYEGDCVKLAFFEDHNFTRHLVEKILL
jgi:NAD+ kinase